MKRLLLSMLLTLPLLAPAQSPLDLDESQLAELLEVKIRTVQHMALNPALIRATRSQNRESLSSDQIRQRDETWKGTKTLTDFKQSLQESSAGMFLRRHVETNGSFNEAFLTDHQGANVAAFPATSDYWQGDEEKWSESFNGGVGRIYLGPLEKDDSTGVYAVQVSAPVLDRGETIGVLVVGVTVDYLDARRGGN